MVYNVVVVTNVAYHQIVVVVTLVVRQKMNVVVVNVVGATSENVVAILVVNMWLMMMEIIWANPVVLTENVYQSAQTILVLAQVNVTMVVVVPKLMRMGHSILNVVPVQTEELAVIVLQKILAVNTHQMVVLVLKVWLAVNRGSMDVVKKGMIVVMDIVNN